MLLTTCLFALAAATHAQGERPGPTPVVGSLPPVAQATLGCASASQPESRTPEVSLAPDSSEESAKFEVVEFKTRDKQVVHAAYYAPKKKGRAPAALLVHDAGSSSAALEEVAENLQRKGFAVLVPDLRGHGASVTETCNWSQMTQVEERMSTWTYAMRDLEASTEYLRDLDNVHNANLSLVGVGAGAVLAVRYASNDLNARAVALIAPDPEAFGYNMLKDIIDLRGLPVLIMTTDEARQTATRIQGAATQANGGHPCVDIKALKPKDAADPLSDRRLSTELAKFLQDEAQPKR